MLLKEIKDGIHIVGTNGYFLFLEMNNLIAHRFHFAERDYERPVHPYELLCGKLFRNTLHTHTHQQLLTVIIVDIEIIVEPFHIQYLVQWYFHYAVIYFYEQVLLFVIILTRQEF